jgi:oligoribonuclease
MSDKKTVLVWVDLETTGLDERKGVGEILEYAVVLTDIELNEIDAVEGVITHDMNWVNDIMNDYVVEMHTKNGLLQEILEASSKSGDLFGHAAIAQAEKMLVGWLLRHKTEDTIFVIAGSTVSFDRRWLKEHMPEFESMLHYRQLDVSVYKVGFPTIFGDGTSEAHRAMPDIRESIRKHWLMRDIMRVRYPAGY